MKIGDMAPNFKLDGSNGKEVSLDDYKGKKNVVLYFYPKDNTPGWITEASEFRDLQDEFNDANTVILGVSPDKMKSHEKFIEKVDIPFILLSDSEKEVGDMYGVFKMKNLFGKTAMGLERSTFVIDKEGKLVNEYRKVKAKGHAEVVLDFVKENLN